MIRSSRASRSASTACAESALNQASDCSIPSAIDEVASKPGTKRFSLALGDDSREKLHFRSDMLERERDPVDDDVEALIAQRCRNGRRVAHVGMDRTLVTRGVALSGVEQREVDAALGEQLRDRERDVAGAADQENAHVHDVIGVG